MQNVLLFENTVGYVQKTADSKQLLWSSATYKDMSYWVQAENKDLSLTSGSKMCCGLKLMSAPKCGARYVVHIRT